MSRDSRAVDYFHLGNVLFKCTIICDYCMSIKKPRKSLKYEKFQETNGCRFTQLL
jgi:hypothetical protein